MALRTLVTDFASFAQLCRELEATTKRSIKVELIAKFLKSLDDEEVAPAVAFITGRPFPESDTRILELAGRTLWKINRSTGQATLVAKPATIMEVYGVFDQIAKATGSGSRRRKENLIDSLLNRMPESDAEYVMRIIYGEMRIGAVEGVVLDSVAEATGISAEKIRRAHMLLGDISQLAELALSKGESAIRNVSVTLFTPIKPMLAEMATGLEEVFKEHGGVTALEFKYDGARIQIHRKGPAVRIFSRRLTDVTDSLPDIRELAKNKIDASEYLVEGEVVALGRNGKPLPFQDLMRRFRRVHEVEAMTEQIPLRLFLFDVIYLANHMLIDNPYRERWTALEGIAREDLMATRIVTGDLREGQALMKASLEAGHEGLMAKDLNSTYTPGVRGKKWFKIKSAVTLDLVIVAADWGSGRRRGWLSNYHLAVRGESAREYLLVGKTFKGLTDEEFRTITKRLLELKIRQTEFTVSVRPEVVVEVAFNEIQRSPQYDSKFALRFARIVRFRDDKRPEDADSLERLNTLYENQFRFKAKGDF
jgi:DNA ligase-1